MFINEFTARKISNIVVTGIRGSDSLNVLPNLLLSWRDSMALFVDNS